MLVTITNTAGRSINVAAVGEDGVALGGGNHPEEATHRTDPLPYPFAHIGTLASSGTKQLPMQPSDWRYNRSEAHGFTKRVNQAWNELVQKGIVTMAFADQTTGVDQETIFTTEV